MPKEKKDFYNVVTLTTDFAEFRQSTLEEVDNPQTDRRSRVHFKLILAQIDVQLAIAQQLAMISKHLGEIVGKSKVTE